MGSIIVILPFIYIFAGCTYGVAAVIRRIYLRAEYTRLPAGERDAIITAAPKGLSVRQGVSLSVSLVFLVSGLYTSFWLFTGNVDNGQFGAMLALVVLTPFLVGLQAVAVWKRDASYSEDAQLSAKNIAARLYYTVLIATWAFGIVGSYVVSFTLLTS